MKVLVLGSGGREHAIVWKLRQSPRVTELYCAPGNGGIASEAECVATDLKNLDSLVQLASRLSPDVTVVGPELPLTLGVVEVLQYFLVPLVLKNGTGEPGGSTLFFNLYIYKSFFTFQNMAYGSALAWILFLITLVVTLLLFASARKWVYYAAER